VLQTMAEIQGLEKNRSNIFLMMTEMYSNALEHGVLNLDSSIKCEENGFSKYYELRQDALNQLDKGKIIISVDHAAQDNKGIITLDIEHDGEGFDYQAVNTCLKENTLKHGRGLALISNLCSKFGFLNEGRQMQVQYEWKYSQNEN